MRTYWCRFDFSALCLFDISIFVFRISHSENRRTFKLGHSGGLAKQMSHRGLDVLLSHQRFAHQHCIDAGLLESLDVHLTGRYGAWTYSYMERALLDGLELAGRLRPGGQK